MLNFRRVFPPSGGGIIEGIGRECHHELKNTVVVLPMIRV